MFVPFSKRGKEWEPTGLALRPLLRLGLEDRLDPRQLAAREGLRVVDGPDVLDVLDGEERVHLLDAGHQDWSGGVYPAPLPDGTYLCILNPTHGHPLFHVEP